MYIKVDVNDPDWIDVSNKMHERATADAQWLRHYEMEQMPVINWDEKRKALIESGMVDEAHARREQEELDKSLPI